MFTMQRRLMAFLAVLALLSAPACALTAENETAAVFEMVMNNKKNALAKKLAADPELAKVKDHEGSTLTHIAVSASNNDMLALLLSNGAPADETDLRGATPLHMAVFDDNLKGVKLLLDAGADIGKKDNAGWSAIYIACAMAHKEMAEELVLSGAAQDVFCAAAAGDMDSVKEYIKNDPSLLQPSEENGFSLLHIAAAAGREELVRLLIEEGAPLDSLTIEGSPLILATLMDRSGCVEILRDAGADIEAVDAEGFTALHWAAMQENKDIVLLLIDADADMQIKSTNGQTALDMAKETKNKDIIAMLKKAETKTIQDIPAQQTKEEKSK